MWSARARKRLAHYYFKGIHRGTVIGDVPKLRGTFGVKILISFRVPPMTWGGVKDVLGRTEDFHQSCMLHAPRNNIGSQGTCRTCSPKCCGAEARRKSKETSPLYIEFPPIALTSKIQIAPYYRECYFAIIINRDGV